MASLSAVIGKMSLESDSAVIEKIDNLCGALEYKSCDFILIIFRVLGFALMTYCNTVMITSFMGALRNSGSLEVRTNIDSLLFRFSMLFI